MPMVNVKNFPSRMYAELARETLKKEGIPSMIQCPDIGIFGGLATGHPLPQGADLYVDEEHARRARELLSALFGDL
jgi:hypothetical protein